MFFNFFIIYPAIFVSFVIVIGTIIVYTPKVLNFATSTPWNLIIGFIGYVIYELCHAFATQEIQILLHINPNQVPHYRYNHKMKITQFKTIPCAI